VAEIRAELRDAPPGVVAYVTGPAGFVADLVAAFGEIDGLLLLVTVVAVLVILLIVYRSPVLPLLVLLSAMAALSVAVIVVFVMAREGWITLNGQAQGILFILVIGAATDYALLLVSRYREALRAEADVLVAIRRGMARRLRADPRLRRHRDRRRDDAAALGPQLQQGARAGGGGRDRRRDARRADLPACAARAASAGGPSSRSRRGWRRPPCGPSPVVYTGGFWARVADLVARRPRRVWVATGVVLLGAAAFAPGFVANGVPQTEVVLGATESAAGQAAQGRFFAAGSGAPAAVIGAADLAEALAAAVAGVPGVDSAALRTPAFGGPPASRPPLVAVVDGRELVELQVTLAFAPDSDAAIDVVRDLREAVRASTRSPSSAEPPPPTSTPAPPPAATCG
jgi:putative drug exporter of the RND superfamily